MILAIDIGNTNVVLGGIEGNDILFEARMATDSIKTSDQYCAELKNILALFDVVPSMIDGTIVASVVPPVLNSFRTAIRKLTGKSCLVVGPGIRTGLNIRMDNPTRSAATSSSPPSRPSMTMARRCSSWIWARRRPSRPSTRTASIPAAASAPA